ncbi:hypothetical protein ACSBR2_036666 [Camellia fascicularis]
MTDRRIRLETTLLLGVGDLSTSTLKGTTATQKLVTRVTEDKMLARKVTHQRQQIEADTTTKMTSRYGRIDTCRGTKTLPEGMQRQGA